MARTLNSSLADVRDGVSVVPTGGMQGHTDPNRELLDAAALCHRLVPEGSVEAFLADHRQELFPDELFADLFPSGRGPPRSLLM